MVEEYKQHNVELNLLPDVPSSLGNGLYVPGEDISLNEKLADATGRVLVKVGNWVHGKIRRGGDEQNFSGGWFYRYEGADANVVEGICESTDAGLQEGRRRGATGVNFYSAAFEFNHNPDLRKITAGVWLSTQES